MAQIPGPNFIGYKPELMADNWHPVVQPLQATITREKNKGKRTPATQLKPYWRTNYPSYYLSGMRGHLQHQSLHWSKNWPNLPKGPGVPVKVVPAAMTIIQL